jgi:hypothetical protein
MIRSSQSLWRPGKPLARAALIGSAFAAAAAALSTGCLDRPVAEQTPNTTNLFVLKQELNKVDKIDLLFMVDNSASMADKQQILSDAVPKLVERFIAPICVNNEGNPVLDGAGNAVASSGGNCPDGQGAPEFKPIKDIHIGVISSSLGSHGGLTCSPNDPSKATRPHLNDLAQLIGQANPPLRDIPASARGFLNPAGFLAWTGEENPTGFVGAFKDVVSSVQEKGCGYEASLEAWYRFLIQPDPPVEVVTTGGASPSTTPRLDAAGNVMVNTVLLQQREQFLRPDSLVAVIMLSDENDCSLRDDGFSWLVEQTDRFMPRSRSECLTNPNDKCCTTCIAKTAPEGCRPREQDPECIKANPADPQKRGNYYFDPLDDARNLRCFEQKRRFGLDFLYPVKRYVDGLRNATVPDYKNVQQPNPLYSPSKNPAYAKLVPRTDPSLVYLAGVVGVPWQSIATADTLEEPEKLKFRTTSASVSEGGIDWDLILGNPNASPPVPPKDPFMRESVEPRTGQHPVTGDQVLATNAPAPAEAMNVKAAGWINGHDYPNAKRDDLQYACIFPLKDPRDCTTTPDGVDCDCASKPEEVNQATADPLCQSPQTSTVGTTQYFAKAYPGTRFLEVLKGFGANSIVASVCPKITDPTKADYGYNPAVAAIVDRLKEAFKSPCLPRRLQTNSKGELACQVVEATAPGTEVPLGAWRKPVPGNVADAVRQKLKEAGRCESESNPDLKCSSFRLWSLQQATGDAATNCLTNENENPGGTGYCYVDPAVNDQVNEKLVEKCPADQRRLLRFISDPGAAVPFERSTLFIACLGDPIAR